MSHWIVVPIVLPAIVASLLLLGLNRETVLERSISLMSTAAMLVVAIALLAAAIHNPPEAYALGNWVAPFGIVMVLDRLSALMLVLTAVLALLVLVYAVHGWDRRGRHFHALFQFQLMGVNGAFLTGDVFNLFVFFEVLLIASYGLMLSGGRGPRTRAGLHYIAFNIVASALFLVALGLIYGQSGALNIGELARRVAAADPAQAPLLKAAAGVLLVVRPGGGLDPVGVAFLLMAVAGNAAYQLLSRSLARSETTVALLLNSAIAGSVCFGSLVPWSLGGPPLSLRDALLFATIGMASGLGHYLLTASFRLAPVSVLGPVTYMQLMWAGILGWVVFGHVPDALSILGMVVICCAGAAVVMRR